MIDFDVITGPNPTEKPAAPEPKPTTPAGRDAPTASPASEPTKRDRTLPRTSKAEDVPAGELDNFSRLQDEEDVDYVRRLRSL
ncbi:MAG: hypothetical protein ACREFI_12470 [Stellaceae bacterium]